MRLIVIGGLGNFGARICRRLAQEPGIEVIATSRHSQKAWQPGRSGVSRLDIHSPTFATELHTLQPDLVIHCAGPFQGQDYGVALASVGCGAHYIDIADGRDFVAGFVNAVGPGAEAAGRLAVTGASTLPALSSAVVDSLKQGFGSMTSIAVVIAPGQRAPRGSATVASVLGYAGKPFQWWQNGQWRTVFGWQELQRERFSFGRRLAAACDVPDLQLLPARYPGVDTVTFRASLEVRLQHYVLWLLAALQRLGLGLPVARWGALFDRMGSWLNAMGSDTGGMAVRIAGKDHAGRTLCRTWELVAASNHGPEIPCMAAVILVNQLKTQTAIQPGARVCMGILALEAFQPEFARWGISTTLQNGSIPTP